MAVVLSIREYEKIHIRSERNLDRNIISFSDAYYLQRVVVDNSPVFSVGNRCLVAQHYVGVIELPDYTIEILPKIYGEVDGNKTRDVLIRMLMVANQTSSIRQFNAPVTVKKNSLVEIVIFSFLKELEKYLDTGMQHDYIKVTNNINKVKGRILFNQQLNKNVLEPTKFYCRYSKYEADNQLNRFFRACLVQMARVSRDVNNQKLIADLLLSFEEISAVSSDAALAYRIEFNSINARARDAHRLGYMFLKHLTATMSAGMNQMYTMIFDMNQLYELFVYRVASIVFGKKVTYQKKGDYMVTRQSDGKRFVSLRPDLTIKHGSDECWIVDTKWKMPNRFAKESDVYQMNAYSSSIPNVSKVVILYPRLNQTESIVGEYIFLDSLGTRRKLDIKTIDLLECLNWNQFIIDFKEILSPDV